MTRSDNRTIDWTRDWDKAAYDEEIGASPSAEFIVDPLLEFLAEMKTPDSYADVGCGNGNVVFAVADQYPDATVIGYDEFNMTSGVSFPFPADEEDHLLREYEQHTGDIDSQPESVQCFAAFFDLYRDCGIHIQYL